MSLQWLVLFSNDLVMIYICMYVCMHACMHVCMYACMYACMDVCMYVWMYACMHGTMRSIMSENVGKKWKVAEIENLPKLKGGVGTEIISRNVWGYPPLKFQEIGRGYIFFKDPNGRCLTKIEDPLFTLGFTTHIPTIYLLNILCLYHTNMVGFLWFSHYGQWNVLVMPFLMFPFYSNQYSHSSAPLIPQWWRFQCQYLIVNSNYADYQSKIIKTFKIIRILNQLYY